MSEEERIKLLSKCKDIDCICQDCLYLEFVKNNILNPIQEEIRRLKKQLENKYSKIGTLTNEVLYEENSKLINQQKEFIKYLEYQVKLQEELNDIHLATGFEEILQKYKEIIGGIK